MGAVFMHALHPVGNLLGVECTACGHRTSSHDAVGYGVWKCNTCGSRCYSAIG